MSSNDKYSLSYLKELLQKMKVFKLRLKCEKHCINYVLIEIKKENYVSKFNQFDKNNLLLTLFKSNE